MGGPAAQRRMATPTCAWRRSPSLDFSVGIPSTPILATAPSTCVWPSLGGSVLVPNANMTGLAGNIVGSSRRKAKANIEDQWSPNCKIGLYLLPEITSDGLCRVVDAFLHACLPCRPCQNLCCALDATTVQNVLRIPMA